MNFSQKTTLTDKAEDTLQKPLIKSQKHVKSVPQRTVHSDKRLRILWAYLIDPVY